MLRGELAEWEENFCLPFYRGGWTDSHTVYLDTHKFYARCTEGGETNDLRGIFATACGTPWAGLNLGFLSEPVRRVSSLSARIDRAFEFYRARGLPWLLVLPERWVAPELDMAIDEDLRRKGFQLAMNAEAISAERLKPLWGDAPLQVTQADSRESWAEIAAINAVSWNVPVEWILPLLGSARFQAEARGWLGRVDGRAVSSVVTFHCIPFTISAWNATLPVFRRRGFGDYIMRFGAAHSEGGHPMFAIASPQGLGTWLAAGYQRRQERLRLYMAPA